VIVFKGRYHFYEGYSMQQVVYPVRIARLLGVKYLFVTNAAGSLNFEFKPGNLVRISDHINMMGTNPLIGNNTLASPVMIDGSEVYEFGERFPSMHAPYNKDLSDLADQIAKENNISLQNGVYCAVTGPMLETKAECLMLKGLGADLVGMSTVPEVITAIHCGLKVLAVSVVTNLSNIFHSGAHSQEEIRENADKASRNLLLLIKNVLGKLSY
jgi:purine-nucleoside phosphorylase